MATSNSVSQRRFTKHELRAPLPMMMCASGDDFHVLESSVAVVEKLLLSYIQEVVEEAMHMAQLRDGQLDTDCFIMCCRKDHKKYRYGCSVGVSLTSLQPQPF
ncbi:unnamed protein product [Chrysoparadoxa australica]